MTQKTPSYLDPQTTLKVEHEDFASAKRVINVDNIVGSFWNRVESTFDDRGSIDNIQFYLDQNYQITTVAISADVSGSLNNKYFLINSALDETEYYVWYNVDNGGTDPAISGKTGIEVDISANDGASAVLISTKYFIELTAGLSNFSLESVDNLLTITNSTLGESTNASDVSTGFTVSTSVDGKSTLLLDRDLEAPSGYEYAYNEITKEILLVPSVFSIGFYVSDASTNTPLGAGETFDTGIIKVSDYSQVISELRADQSGTLKGTWYSDELGSTIVREFQAPYNSTEELAWFASSTLSEYLRVEFENGATPQTFFHYRLKLQTIPQTGQLLKLESFVPSNAITPLVRSVITGKDPTGLYRNINTNDAGALQTSDFRFDVARDSFDNYEIATKFGNNPDVDTATDPEDVWYFGGVYTGQPLDSVTPETISVSSSSSSDNSTGTGARTLTLFGLDSDYNEIEETVTLNGTTPVVTTNTWRRMFRMKIDTAGSTGSNIGTIQANYTTSTSVIFGVVGVGLNQTSIAATTVPAGKTMYIVRTDIQIGRTNGSAGSAIVSIRIREQGGVFRADRLKTITTSLPYSVTYEGAIIVPEKSDIKVRCEEVSDNNTSISAEFEYILVDNEV